MSEPTKKDIQNELESARADLQEQTEVLEMLVDMQFVPQWRIDQCRNAVKKFKEKV